MRTKIANLTALAQAFLIVGCAQAPEEISRDTQPFAQMAEDATVSLLGTEPFWSIEIEPANGGYVARYSTPENMEGDSFVVQRFAGNNGVGFNGELAGEAVQIALSPGACGDAMSDRTYPYAATLSLGSLDLRGCGYTSEEPFVGEPSP